MYLIIFFINCSFSALVTNVVGNAVISSIFIQDTSSAGYFLLNAMNMSAKISTHVRAVNTPMHVSTVRMISIPFCRTTSFIESYARDCNMKWDIKTTACLTAHTSGNTNVLSAEERRDIILKRTNFARLNLPT